MTKAFEILRRKVAAPDLASVFQFPTLEDRAFIFGRTGSGKTVAGGWLLSEARFDLQPFIIINFKREKLFRSIDRAKQIDLNDALPNHPGLYHMEPLATDEDAVEQWLWKVWRKGNTALFVDETYLMPERSKALKALLTTGRSLHIPMTLLSQRPVSIPRFTISEANFYQGFPLQDVDDQKRVEGFTPKDDNWDFEKPLKKYHSRWYDVGQGLSLTLKPVPDINRILNRFDTRLTPRRKLI